MFIRSTKCPNEGRGGEGGEEQGKHTEYEKVKHTEYEKQILPTITIKNMAKIEENFIRDQRVNTECSWQIADSQPLCTFIDNGMTS